MPDDELRRLADLVNANPELNPVDAEASTAQAFQRDPLAKRAAPRPGGTTATPRRPGDPLETLWIAAMQLGLRRPWVRRPTPDPGVPTTLSDALR